MPTTMKITLAPLTEEDREAFVLDNQEAFRYGALEEFGLRDDHVNEDGEIIDRDIIEEAIDDESGEAYRILLDGEKVGGMVLNIDRKTHRNRLEFLFVHPRAHGLGIGYRAWQAAEALYPETEVWETCTPYFEKRNIHFYVNKCGFSIVEFFCEHHDPSAKEGIAPGEGPDEMFRFEKRMK